MQSPETCREATTTTFISLEDVKVAEMEIHTQR